ELFERHTSFVKGFIRLMEVAPEFVNLAMSGRPGTIDTRDPPTENNIVSLVGTAHVEIPRERCLEFVSDGRLDLVIFKPNEDEIEFV
ncbi:hypothetical protein S245_015675, partial [Arachis hypogaea]